MVMPRKWKDDKECDRAYYERNKPRIQEYKRQHYQKGKHRVRAAKYGLTVEQLAALEESQGNLCLLCSAPAEDCRDGRLSIDHDHITGRVRGLLCNHCNLGLGHFRDDPELMRRAADYLLDRRVVAA